MLLYANGDSVKHALKGDHRLFERITHVCGVRILRHGEDAEHKHGACRVRSDCVRGLADVFRRRLSFLERLSQQYRVARTKQELARVRERHVGRELTTRQLADVVDLLDDLFPPVRKWAYWPSAEYDDET